MGARIEPGSTWRHEALGTTAEYVVVADEGDHVLVQVREAPGLRPGTQIRLTRKALLAMTAVAGGGGAPTPTAGHNGRHLRGPSALDD
jgi:hypothetical protein